jgi:TetR/AcrR family transcriptional repressor of nem operon
MMTTVPQKAYSKKSTTKQRLVETGLELMGRNGFHCASLQEILSVANVPKGSFYYYFKSKEAFGIEVLESYWQEKVAWVESFLHLKHVSPINRLRLLSLDAMLQIEQSGFELVCMASRVNQERDTSTQAFKSCLEKGHAMRQSMLRAFFVEAQAFGEVPSNIHIDYLVESYQTHLDGALLESKLTRSLRPFQVMHWLFFECLCRPSHRLSEDEETKLTLS